MRRKIIPLRELPLKNDFMFDQVMRTPEICKLFLEALLHTKIDHIEYVETQKVLKVLADGYDRHSVRLDVYLLDGKGTVYCVEMQAVRKHGLKKRRARYYLGCIDRRELMKGQPYSELPETYVIFVCDFDYFGTGLAVNERESYIKGTDEPYKDGSHVIFLNSRYEIANAEPAIIEYLDYIRTSDDAEEYSSELLHKTVERVQDVRNNDEMEGRYMMWELRYQEAMAESREEGCAEGREEGRKEGRKEGRSEGKTEGILSSIRSLMETMNLTIEQAMTALQVSETDRPQYTALLSNP